MEVPDSELAGRVVMVVWHRAHAAETIQPLLKGLMERVGKAGRVVVENAERLSAGKEEKRTGREREPGGCGVLPFLYPPSPPYTSLSPCPVTHPQSSVDVVLSGFLPPPSLSHSPSLLAEIARVLKPSGTALLREPVTLEGRAVLNIKGVENKSGIIKNSEALLRDLL